MLQLSFLFALVAVLGITNAAPELKKRACPVTAPKVKPVMASGYTSAVVMNGLKTPREMVFDPLGNLLVIEQGGGGLRRIVLSDNGGIDVCSASSKTLVADATVCALFHLVWMPSKRFQHATKKCLPNPGTSALSPGHSLEI